jgi:hypothetical protein
LSVADRAEVEPNRRLAAPNLGRRLGRAGAQIAAFLLGLAALAVAAAGPESVDAAADFRADLVGRAERERPEVVAVDEVCRGITAGVAFEVTPVDRVACPSGSLAYSSPSLWMSSVSSEPEVHSGGL